MANRQPRAGFLKMHHRERESVRMNEFQIQWVTLFQSSIHGPACGLFGTAELLPHNVEALMQQTQELYLTVHIHLDYNGTVMHPGGYTSSCSLFQII